LNLEKKKKSFLDFQGCVGTLTYGNTFARRRGANWWGRGMLRELNTPPC